MSFPFSPSASDALHKGKRHSTLCNCLLALKRAFTLAVRPTIRVGNLEILLSLPLLAYTSLAFPGVAQADGNGTIVVNGNSSSNFTLNSGNTDALGPEDTKIDFSGGTLTVNGDVLIKGHNLNLNTDQNGTISESIYSNYISINGGSLSIESQITGTGRLTVNGNSGSSLNINNDNQFSGFNEKHTSLHNIFSGDGSDKPFTINANSNIPLGNFADPNNIDLTKNSILNMNNSSSLGNHVLSLYNSSVSFYNQSQAATATIENGALFDTATSKVIFQLDDPSIKSRPVSSVDISHSEAPVVFIGALGGSGDVNLGGNTLATGWIGYSKEISGAITGNDKSNFVLTTEPGGPSTTTILSGNNSYTGGTYIGGTYARGSILELSANGTIAKSSVVRIVNYAKLDISNISDASTSIQSLSGDAVSGVTLSSKDLVITNAHDTPGKDFLEYYYQPDVNAAGTLKNPIAFSGQGFSMNKFEGVITGLGGVTLSGGSEVFTGQNTYSGLTTVQKNAALALSQGGSVAGDALTNGTLTLDDGTVGGKLDTGDDKSATTFAVSQNGGSVGSLNNNGRGTLAGTLKIRGGSGSYGGTMDGAGGVTLLNTSNETFTNKNTYTGNTELADKSTLNGQYDSFGTGTLDVSPGATANLDDERDGSLTNKGLTGQGTINIINTGALTLENLDGSNFNGTINLSHSDSRLNVNTVLGANSTVNANGQNSTLSGTGTVGYANIASGANLTPGTNSNGQLTIANNLDMKSGSNLNISITGRTPDNADGTLTGTSVKVGNTATLEGTINLNLNGADSNALTTSQWTYPKINQTYTVLTAKTINSADKYKLTPNSLFIYALGTTMNNADNMQELQVILERNGTSFGEPGKTINQKHTGAAVDSLPVNNVISRALYPMNAAEVRQTLNNLSGEIHASVRTGLIQDSYMIRNAVLNRMDNVGCEFGKNGQGTYDLQTHRKNDACDSTHTVLWGQAYGSIGSNAGDGNAASMHHNTAGFIMGVDTPFRGSNWRAGGFVSYGHSMFNIGQGRSSSANSNNLSVGGYGGTHWGGLNLRLGASYTWNIINTRRQIAVGNVGGRATSGYLGGTAQGFAELGYKIHLGRTVFEPFANVAYVNMQTNSFRERGTAAALRGRNEDTGVTFSTFGFRAASRFNIGKAVFMPHIMGAYRHAFGNTGSGIQQSFASGGSEMGINGVLLSRSAAVIDTGVTARLTNRVDLDVSYIGQYGNRSVDSGATGAFKFRF